MDVSEKVLLLKQDFDDVYAAGKSAGGGDYDQGYEDGYTQGEADGSFYWKKVSSFTRLFMGQSFPTDTEIVLDISNDRSVVGSKYYDLDNTFNGANIKSVKLIMGDKNYPLRLYCTFQGCANIETVDLSDNPSIMHLGSAFMYSNIVEIIGELDCSKATADYHYTSAFEWCSYLTTIRFKKETISCSIAFAQSSKLTDESIQSIIDGLADLTGSTAQTLTLRADVGAKLTDEQKATITAKNWTLVY